MNPVDWSSLAYAYFLITSTLVVALWRVFKYAVKNIVDSSVDEICKRLDKIDYALYNDGKTGLVNKVDALIENQQLIKIDVEVMKAKYEN